MKEFESFDARASTLTDSSDDSASTSVDSDSRKKRKREKRHVVLRKVNVPKIKVHSPSVDTGNTILEAKIVMVPKKLEPGESPRHDDKVV